MTHAAPASQPIDEAPNGFDEFGGPIGVGPTRTVRAAWAPTTVAASRRAIAADLQARGVSATIVDEAQLVISELVTNALRHAMPLADDSVRLKWKAKGDIVEIEVSDGGSQQSSPKPLKQQVWAPNGRGLRIVRSVAHEWGVQETDKGTTVWACLGGPSRRRVNS